MTQYALTRRGVLHRWPAWEACNLDEAKAEVIFTTLADAEDASEFRRYCRRCFKETRHEG